MGTSVMVVVLAAASAVGATIPQAQYDKQAQSFQRWWGTEFVWKFDELPTEGAVPDHRIPYSGYIYPDTGGGTISVLRKYDRVTTMIGNRIMTTQVPEPWKRP